MLNSKGSVIYAQKFDFIRHLEVPLPESGSEEQGGPSRVAIKEPEAVIVIPYLSEGKSIRVKGPYGATPLTATPALSASYRASSSKPSPAPAMEGKLYILIMASGYSEMSGFQAKAQETKDYLLSKEPFASRVEDIIISIYENTADLGCYTGYFDIDRLMCCDSEKVIAAAVASGMLYDEIIII